MKWHVKALSGLSTSMTADTDAAAFTGNPLDANPAPDGGELERSCAPRRPPAHCSVR